MRLRTWVIALFSTLALLALGGTALAQQGQPGQGNQNRQGNQGKMKQAAQHVMHAHREAFIDGKVVKVDTDRGSVVSTTDNSVELKFEDGSQAKIDTVGQVHVCIDGRADAKVTDLNGGDEVSVTRATNTPKGDHTLVVKKSNEGNLRSNCHLGQKNGDKSNPAPQQGN